MNRCLKKIGLILAVIAVMAGASCDTRATGTQYSVRYEVSGSATYIYYFTPSGQRSVNSPSTPWSYSFSTSNRNQTINLGATSGGSTVYVRMYVQSSLAASDSASGGLTAMTGTYTIADFL